MMWAATQQDQKSISDDLNTTWTKDVVEYKLTGPETASQQNWSSQQLELVDAKLNVA